VIFSRTFLARQYLGLFTASTLMAVADFCIGIVGPIVSGHCLGVDSFAALAAVYAYRLIPDIFAMLIADGTAALYAQALGRCDREDASRLFTLGLFVSVAVGVVLTISFLVFEGPYLDFVGVTGAVRTEAFAFGRGYVWTFLPTMVIMYFFGLTYVDGGARLCFFGSVAYVILNVLSSWLLCTRFGTAGLAWSVNVALLAFAAVSVIHLISKSCTFRLNRSVDLHRLVSVIALGFGTAIQPIAGSVLSFVLARFASVHFSRDGLAALSAVSAVECLLYFPKAAGQAALPLVSVYRGEGNAIGVRRTMQLAFKPVLIECVLLSLMLAIWPRAAIWIFGLDDTGLLVEAVRIVGLFLMPAALTFFWCMYFRMIGQAGLVLLFCFCQWIVFPLVATITLADLFGIPGLACNFLGQTAWLVLAVGLLRVYASARGLSFPLLQLKSVEAEWMNVSVAASVSGAVEAASVLRARLRDRLRPDDRRELMIPLAAEEMVNVVSEANSGQPVRIELALDLSNRSRLRLIVRDDGVIFDPTDPDRKVGSLASYTLASLVAGGRERVNLTTGGYNRSILVFSRSDEGEVSA